MTREEATRILVDAGIPEAVATQAMRKMWGEEITPDTTPERLRYMAASDQARIADFAGQAEEGDREELDTRIVAGEATPEETRKRAEEIGNDPKSETEAKILERLEGDVGIDSQLQAALLGLSGGTPVDADEVLEALRELNPTLDLSQGVNSLAIHLANPQTMALVQVAVARATEGTVGGWVTVQTGTRAFKDPGSGMTRHEPTFTHVRSDQYEAAVTSFPGISDQIGRAVTIGKQTGIDWRVIMAATDADKAAEPPKPRPKGWKAGIGRAFAEAGTRIRMGEVSRQLAEDARQFSGSIELALLARKDENLARSIYERGYASPSEAGQVAMLMGDEYERLAAMGTPLNPMKLAALEGSDPYGGAGGGGGIQYTLPDPASVTNEVTNLFRAWFQRDPAAGEAEAFLGKINDAIVGEARSRSSAGKAGNIFKGIDPVDGTTGSAGVTDVDPQARLLEYARSQPDYQRLFNQRPVGMSEDEYAAQFSGAATQFLGQMPASDAIRSGMETGSIQTTLGAAMASEAAKESSSLLGRMARAAQLINGMT